MIISILIIPILLIVALIMAIIKKKDAFNAFCEGALEGLKLSKEIIPSKNVIKLFLIFSSKIESIFILI